MEILATVAFSLGVIAYSVASTLYFLELTRGRAPSAPIVASRALLVGVAFHAVHLEAVFWLRPISPLAGIHFTLSAATLVTTIAFLTLRERWKLDALGAFVGPLALTFLIAAQFVDAGEPPLGVSRLLLFLHVTSNLLGLGFVLLAGGASAFYLFSERRLKNKKHVQAKGQLPSLDALDLVGHRLLLIGFPLLSVGVVSGGVFFAQLGSLSGLSFVRAGLGYVTWGLVAGVLFARAVFGYRGRRAAYGTLLGVLFLSLVLFIYLIKPHWSVQESSASPVESGSTARISLESSARAGGAQV